MSEPSRWMLYGATGYTGTLIAEEAVRRGHRPLLAGRSADKLAALGARLALPTVAVGLDDAAGMLRALEGIGAVLHCAGPFLQTSAPMIAACLRAKASYLDITGELPVFEAAFAQDEKARESKVALIPGVGFDVVPTDCLAVHVARQVPNALGLELAIAAIGQPSAGTAKSALGMLPRGGWVRRGGKLLPQPLGRGVRRIAFSHRELWAMPVPLGDLVTAAHSTGVTEITGYLGIPSRAARFLQTAGPLAALGLGVARRLTGNDALLQAAGRYLEKRGKGADLATRTAGRTFVWARAWNEQGQSAQAWLEAVDGYDFTAACAVRAVESVLAKNPQGALAPAQAFGADFVLEIPGTRRLDTLG